MINKLNKYLVWDVETCHLNLIDKSNKVWQIGYLLCEDEKIIDRKFYYVKWLDIRVHPEAARVTRFNKEEYERNWIEPNIVLEEFESYLYNPEYICLGHNVIGFDIFIHNIFRSLLNKKPDYSYINRIVDTNALGKLIKLGIKYNSYNKESFLSYQYRGNSIIMKGLKTNLQSLGKELDIEFPYEELHQSIRDVELNFLIWNKWIKPNLMPLF